MKNSTFKNWRFTTDMMMCDYILSEDHEHSMARSEIKVIQSAINRLMQKLKGEGNIEAWVQSKITKAADYIDTAADYLYSDEVKEATDGIKAKDYKGRLDKWFDDDGWVQTGGKYDGKPCAKQPGQTTKPYCRDPDDRADMSREERNKRASKKRREDPNPNRTGEAKMVTQESAGEKDACYKKVKSRYKVWPSAYASGALVKCRKVGADSWGTKSESTNSLDGDWHTPIRERADRYCPKCEKLERRSECKYGSRYWDMFSLPAEIISSKKDYNITMPYPANGETNIDENYLRIQTRGSTYTILINWRGKYITTQMFFQQFTRPTKTEVTREIRKVYPNAIVLAFNPSANDPTKPLLFTGEPNGPKSY